MSAEIPAPHPALPPVQGWRQNVATPRQIAAVRRITLDDGPEHGHRALAFSTGGGLDFWALADRGLDIGPLWWRGMPMAWEHPNGHGACGRQRTDSDGGTGAQRLISGFVLTCGLDNARQPRAGLPLHGTLPGTPARILAAGEDWTRPEPLLFAEAEVVSAHLERTAFRLRRRIEAPVGGSAFVLSDTVENIGTQTQEMMILYHINLGFPALGPGMTLELDGEDLLADGGAREGDGTGPGAAPGGVRCMPTGKGRRFTAAFARPAGQGWPAVAATVSGDSDALPFLQVWRDRRPHRNILAVEPANCGRAADGTSRPGMMLRPGECWSASLSVGFG